MRASDLALDKPASTNEARIAMIAITTRSSINVNARKEGLFREAGYDLGLLFQQVRERERQAAARGVKFVSFAETRHDESASVLREEPPEP